MRLQTEHQQGNTLSGTSRRHKSAKPLHRSQVRPTSEHSRMLLNHVCRWNLLPDYSMELSEQERETWKGKLYLGPVRSCRILSGSYIASVNQAALTPQWPVATRGAVFRHHPRAPTPVSFGLPISSWNLCCTEVCPTLPPNPIQPPTHQASELLPYAGVCLCNIKQQ